MATATAAYPSTGPPTKRSRTDVVSYSNPATTTSLAAPTMRLTGHTGSVYTLAYDPTGTTLASGSFDKKVLLWNTESGDCENYNVLEGHKNAVLDLKFLQDDVLVTASADKTLGAWDTNTGQRLKKCTAHTGIVNSVDVAQGGDVFCSASDDATVKLWDVRVSKGGLTASLPHDYSVTSVAYGPDNQVFTGGIDNWIHCWDVRQEQKVYSMKGHTDTITYLSMHPKGTHLLSNSMDQTVRSWDIRPFVQGSRHKKTFTGATHNAEKALLKCAWSGDGQMVSAGSADRMVHIWDELTAEELYLLPGHSGTVQTTIFHPTLSQQIASGSSDNTIYVGELG
jgi:Prp8 binding protein